MSTITDNFQATAAAWEIEQRIIAHTAVGGLLEGLKYDVEGTLKVEGEDDLPLLQPWNVVSNESIFKGAPNPRSAGLEKANTPCAERLTLIFRVACSRKNGFFRRDPTNESQEKGFLEWIALIKDAIETPFESGKSIEEMSPDARMGGMANTPVQFSIQENTTTQLVFQCYLEVVVELKPWCRGQRSFSPPPP
jgi:hypothetical protein